MKSYTQVITEDRRMMMLRLLSEAPEYALNSTNLYGWLLNLKIPATRALVLQDLRFLADAGLVRLESLADIENLYAVTLTPGGLDVSAGREIVNGVSRPEPK